MHGSPGAAEGARLGPYRLQRELGRGGMGTVYLAERDGAPGQTVAVKVLQRGLDRDEHRERFFAERRILASLDHPHIARLLDGGVAPDGRPYLVMRYVPGEPIDAWADRQRLTVPERLRLFRTVALAVHHAHAALVVHRDLKPSNILVTPDGEPTLLDFGIAKLLDPDPDATMTHTEVRMMTPEFASPEQVTGGAITTGTDVYALGLLLYELLTGHRAQRLGGQSSTEIAHVITHVDPPRPSEVVRMPAPQRGGATALPPEKLAERRRTTPSRLARQLRGDVDRIVETALAKDPALRYRSAEQLADDVDRLLKGQPIVARGAPRLYRLTRFLRRHRVEAAAAAILVIVLAAYAITVSLQAARVRAALADAQAEAAKAQEVTAFMLRLFEAGDPSSEQGDQVTARELLERGMARAESLSAQPRIQGQLFDVVGQVYERLGRFASARRAFERAVETRTSAVGATHPETLESRVHLAAVLRQLGDNEAAVRVLREVLAVQEPAASADDLALAKTRYELGAALAEVSQLDEAERVMGLSLEVRRARLGRLHADVADSLAGLAFVVSRKARYREAERLYREGADVVRAIRGQDHPDFATAMGSLAGALENLGRADEAERLHADVLALRRRLHGPEHPRVATTLNNRGVALMRLQRYDEAEQSFREAAAIRRKVLGETHPSTLTSLNNVASALVRSRRLAEGAAVLEDVVRIAKARPGEPFPNLAVPMTNLAEARLNLGQTDLAEALAREALAGRARVQGPDHPERASSLIVLGKVAAVRGRWADAERLVGEAVQLRAATLGEQHAETGRARAVLADVQARRSPVPPPLSAARER